MYQSLVGANKIVLYYLKLSYNIVGVSKVLSDPKCPEKSEINRKTAITAKQAEIKWLKVLFRVK